MGNLVQTEPIYTSFTEEVDIGVGLETYIDWLDMIYFILDGYFQLVI